MPAAADTATRVEKRDVAQTIFADRVFAARVVSGVARFDLFVTEPRPDGKMEPVVVGRLVVPLEALERFVRGMSMVLDQIKRDTAPKPAEPKPAEAKIEAQVKPPAARPK